MEIGVISQLHGIFGPPGLVGFLSGIDELWIAGDIGSEKTLAMWKDIVPSVVAVGSAEDKEKGISVPKVIMFERQGYRIMMAHRMRNKKDSKMYAWMSEDVAKKAFNNRIHVCVGGFTGEMAVYEDRNLSSLYLNPGAVTPLVNDRCSALRFVLGKDGIHGFRQFSAVCPPAYTRKEGKTFKTFAFIEGCVLDGKYAEYSAKMEN